MAATATTATATTTTTSTSNEDNTMGMLAHILMIITAWLGPLILYLVKKDQGGNAAANAKEALNFGITATLGYLVGAILLFIVIGIFVYIAVGIASLVFGILGALAANRGEVYRYPVSLRLVK